MDALKKSHITAKTVEVSVGLITLIIKMSKKHTDIVYLVSLKLSLTAGKQDKTTLQGGRQMFNHCVTHSAINIDGTWDYVDDLLYHLKALNKPSFQSCCPKCNDIERRNEIFRERCASGYYEKEKETTKQGE